MNKVEETDLHIDIETFSSIDIKKSGKEKYATALDFEILLLAYSLGNKPIIIIDIANGEFIPKEFIDNFNNPKVKKWAHNAAFERTCFNAIGLESNIDEWYCTSVLAASAGLPLSLKQVSEALKLGDASKSKTGTALIKYFCVPCKPTKVNGYRHRNLPHHNTEKWQQFKEYCIQDVVAEKAIHSKLSHIKITPFERNLYILDQQINDTGVKVDIDFAKQCIALNIELTEIAKNRIREITKVQNPGSVAQLKKWLSSKLEMEIKSLTKETIPEILEKAEAAQLDSVIEVINLRKKTSKTSVKKYAAMLNYAFISDRRVRGLFQFNGASRTGRWAGRGVQLHNLPRIKLKKLDVVRNIVYEGSATELADIYDNPFDILSQLIRTAFIAKKDHKLIVADFSAIEARVLSWIAEEDWRMDVFNTHGKIYEASASMMFNVPLEEITKESELRFKGKTAELALGYQGAVGAMTRMDSQGKLSKQEMETIVTVWREANPKIVEFWKQVNKFAIRAVSNPSTVYKYKSLKFLCNRKELYIKLPSGRLLVYQSPALRNTKYGLSLRYMNLDDKRKWAYVDTYGGKLTENIVQAIARDLLAFSMITLTNKGYNIIMHVHDEVVIEFKSVSNEADEKTYKTVCKLMAIRPSWAQTLPLKASGYITNYYKK